MGVYWFRRTAGKCPPSIPTTETWLFRHAMPMLRHTFFCGPPKTMIFPVLPFRSWMRCLAGVFVLSAAASPAAQISSAEDAEAAARALAKDQEKAGYVFRAEAW